MLTASKKSSDVMRRWLPILIIGAVVGAASAWFTSGGEESWVATGDLQIRDTDVLAGTAALAIESPTTWRDVAASENISTDEFLRSIEADPVGGAVVNVSYRSSDLTQALRIVEQVAESFIARSAPSPIDQQLQAIDTHLSTLQTRRAELKTGIESEVDPVVASRYQTRLEAVENSITQTQLLSDQNETTFAAKNDAIPVLLSVGSASTHAGPPNPFLNATLGGLAGVLAALVVGCLFSPPLATPSAGIVVGHHGKLATYPPVGSSVELLVKRLFDVALGALGLLALSPIFVVVAIGVKATSPGPVLFRQERIGHRGERFLINKFRTMGVVNDDSQHREFVTAMLAEDGVEVAAKEGGIFKLDDPRVTPIGAFLRRYSLDELPQLWNVVRGEMSLIGPRPSLPWEHDLYSTDLKQRVRSKPGCSGLWQVSGHNKLTVPEMLELDIEYVERWTLRLDIEVLFRTPQAIFGRGQTR